MLKSQTKMASMNYFLNISALDKKKLDKIVLFYRE